MTAGALLRCSGCGVRRWVRFVTDGSGHHQEEPTQCKCTPAPRAQPIPSMPKPHADKSTQEKIREYVASRLATDHTLKAETVADEVRQRFEVEIGMNTFYTTYWAPLRKEAKETAPSPNGNGSHPPVNRIAKHLAEPTAQLVSPAVLSEALIEENRSLRAMYEADDFFRVEEEDGEFRLRVNLAFTSRAEAFRAAAALAGALEGE